MFMKRLYWLLSVMFLAGCHGDPPMVGRPVTQGPDIKEHMINANRTIAQSEETVIDEYIARRGWPMEKKGDGVRLWVYHEGKGHTIEMEDTVEVRYNIEAINGKKIYDYAEESYVAGHRRDIIGLDMAVMGLPRCSKAKVIVPSNLGYGIGGDGNRIPQSAILVMDIEVR